MDTGMWMDKEPTEHDCRMAIQLLLHTIEKFSSILEQVLDSNGIGYTIKSDVRCSLCDYYKMDCSRCPLKMLPHLVSEVHTFCMRNDNNALFCSSGIMLREDGVNIYALNEEYHQANVEWLEWFISENKKILKYVENLKGFYCAS